MIFSLKPVLAQWLRNRGLSVYDVTYYEEYYCHGNGMGDSYDYDEWTMSITYREEGDLEQYHYIFYGKFSDLIRELEDIEFEDINS